MSAGVIRVPSAMMTARWILFCNSRTFPARCNRLRRARFRGKNQARLAALGGELLQKIRRYHGNIFVPVPERGQRDDDDGEAKVQVLAEAPIGDGMLQVRVRGGDNSHVALDFLPAANAHEGLVLEKSEDFHLNRERQISNLVQEQSAFFRIFNKTFALHVSAGERSLFMAEKLALEQIFGNRAAVDGDERPIFPQAAPVNSFRDHLLSGSALPKQENGSAGRGHFANCGEHLLHLRARSDQPFKCLLLRSELQIPVFAFQVCDIETASKKELQFFDLDRFTQEIKGA
jgi:hypothetical protein